MLSRRIKKVKEKEREKGTELSTEIYPCAGFSSAQSPFLRQNRALPNKTRNALFCFHAKPLL